MRSLVLFITALTLSFSSPAQVFEMTYGTSGSEDAYPMEALPDGGFILAGSSWGNGAGGKDVMLVRTDSLGNLLWSKQYGGSGDETALYIIRLSDGGFAVCGESFSDDVNGDAFLFRTDSLGNLSWWKNYGAANYDIAYSVVELHDGNLAISGLTETTPSQYDAFVAETDATGDTLWTQTIGGPGIDHAVQMIETSDDAILFCGKSLSYGAGSCDCFLVKIDENGDTLWTKTIGGAGWDESMDVIERPDGFAICGGTTSSGSGSYDFLLMKTDLSGNLQWAKTYGGAKIEASYCIIDVAGTGYAFAGYTETFGPGHSRGTDSANAMLILTDYSGDTIWAASYGGLLKEECFSVRQTHSGGYAIAGYTGSFGDSLQAYLFATDPQGNTGCNDRRAHPDVANANFACTSYAYDVFHSLHENSFAAAEAPLYFSPRQVCGGPLSSGNRNETGPLLLYPNPAAGFVTVCTDEKETTQITLKDVTGKTAGTYFTGANGNVVINTNGLAAGIYFVSFVKKDGSCISRKFIIQ
ncbi:MAG TPA: T9SS type A sorting domain-containing protein [Bacteroidia bacterium]|nr:T9SS type A sorting domain-containing protein [Bacteroidia bacterium]